MPIIFIPTQWRDLTGGVSRLDVDGGNVREAVDALELAEHVDQIVLFSGDGDFRPLVEALQRRGVRVTVVSTISCQPPMVADELRRQADVFTDLMELKSKVGRDPSERPAPTRAASSHAGVLAATIVCDLLENPIPRPEGR